MTLSKVASGNETRAEKAEEEKNWEGVENLYAPPPYNFSTHGPYQASTLSFEFETF